MVPGLDLGKILTKSAPDCSTESSICISKSQKKGGIGELLEDEVGKMWTRLYTKNVKTQAIRAAPSVSAARALVDLV